MLVTFSVVDTSSVFVFNRKLTFAKDDLTLNDFFISKNVSVNTIVEIKVGSSLNSLCSVELSCINDILISDFSSYICFFLFDFSNNCFHIQSSSRLLFKNFDCFLRKIIHTSCLASPIGLNVAPFYALSMIWKFVITREKQK